MPELPEVEYTARQLQHAIIDATISEALVFWQRTIGHPDLPNFLAEIANRRILGVRRRGKFLVMDLEGDLLLTIHRRMSGNLLLLPPGWEIDTSLREGDLATWDRKGPTFSLRETHSGQQGNQQTIVSSPETAYCRVCFNLTDGRRLLFTDPRKFGRIELWPRAQEAEALARLGPEPLSDEFMVESLAERLAGRRGAIKQVLLSQEVIAGLGNIYADEALFYARIHPLRRAGSLTTEEVRLLHEGIIAVLTLGIEHGGTSFNEYRDLWGEAGDNYNHVRVYQQEGKPCPRCGTLIKRIVVGQRGTHFCPTCQKFIPE
ncbi:MAG TPA: DNA-formamidopyrimidine glycosylase [Ktedonobacteraceae bacterium]|jgi:formamidopyrimidine-DNA glycosylase|nr:DNA-formamidopyrimidine glycosylase [Ktedonobacteraceae bacterium]